MKPQSEGVAQAKPPGGATSTPLARLNGALDRGWDRVASMRPATFAVALAALVVVRSGLSFDRADVPFALEAADAFPRLLEDWRAHSLVGPSLAGILGIGDERSWFTLNLVVIVATALLAGRLLVQRAPNREAAITVGTWLALASFPVAVLQRIGWYDIFTVAGALLVILGRRRSTALLGGALLGLTSAEQALFGLASAALVAAACAPDDHDTRQSILAVRASDLGRRILLGAAAVAASRIAVIATFKIQGTDPPGRDDILKALLGQSLERSLEGGGSAIFAWLGLGWGLVALTWFLRDWPLRRWLAMVGGLVALPAFATVTTMDGTRVFAMVSLPALLVVAAWVADRLGEVDHQTVVMVRRVTVAVLVAAPLLPAVISHPFGDVSFAFPWSRITQGA